MTDEELRAIDVRVHREVMKLECEWGNCGPGFDWGQWTVHDFPDGTVIREFDAIPYYTKQLDPAFAVIDALSDRQVAIVIEDWRPLGMPPDKSWAALAELPDAQGTGNTPAESLPLAVSLLALELVTSYPQFFSPNVPSGPQA